MKDENEHKRDNIRMCVSVYEVRTKQQIRALKSLLLLC